jgi:hypothetical protein
MHLFYIIPPKNHFKIFVLWAILLLNTIYAQIEDLIPTKLVEFNYNPTSADVS